MIFQNSECKKGWFHRLMIIAEYPEGVVERCVICHKKIFHRVLDGRVNNKTYISYHARSALPKEHRRYTKEYGQIQY